MRLFLLTATILLLTTACGNPERDKLDRGVTYARRTIEAVNRNPMAAASLASCAEQGGSLVDYLAANASENAAATLPSFENDKPTRQWTVVLSWSSSTNVLIQGYGTDLAKPLVTATAYVKPVKVE